MTSKWVQKLDFKSNLTETCRKYW